MTRTLATAIAVIAATVSPVLADAPDPARTDAPDPARTDATDPARALSDRGRAYHDLGLYDQAIVSYMAAYAIAPAPGVLFNLAQAYRLAGDCANAAIMYRNYLQLDTEQNRPIARTHLATVERCVSERAMRLPATRTHSIEGASVQPAVARLEPRSGLALERTGTAVAIGGGALLGVGVYFAFRASSASAEIERRYAGGATFREVEDIDARGRRSSTLARGFVVGGGLAAITGGVLYLVGRSRSKQAERRITVTPHPGGGQVGMTWAF